MKSPSLYGFHASFESRLMLAPGRPWHDVPSRVLSSGWSVRPVRNEPRCGSKAQPLPTGSPQIFSIGTGLSLNRRCLLSVPYLRLARDGAPSASHHTTFAPESHRNLQAIQTARSLGEGTLATCARVCRTWFIPAIEILWCEIAELRVMFELLGPVWFDDTTLCWDFFGPIPRSQWDRFYIYTKEIRSLGSNVWIVGYNIGVYSISYRALGVLSSPQHTEGGPLFPQLRALKIRFNIDDDFEAAVTLFDQPRLSSLDIAFAYETSPEPPTALIRALSISAAPRLVALSISHERSDVNYGWLAWVIPSLTALERLKLLGRLQVTSEVFDAISRLPRLRELATQSLFQNDPSPFLFGEDAFPRLESLHARNVRQDSLMDACVGSPTFPPSTLRSLTCSLQPNSLLTLMTSFVKSQSKTQHLKVGIATEAPHINRILALISNLRHMQTLDLFRNTGGFVLTDNEVEMLAQGLPELRELRLKNYVMGGLKILTPAPTLLSIHHLLALCPHIQLVSFGINAASAPSMDPIQPSTLRCSWPLRLIVFSSPLSEPSTIANWLEPRCARFTRVEIESGGEVIHKWREVQILLNYA